MKMTWVLLSLPDNSEAVLLAMLAGKFLKQRRKELI